MHFPPMVRKRMVELSENEGMSTEEIASVFGASESGVRRVLQRFRERGTHLALPRRAGRKLLMTPSLAQQIRDLVTGRPDATRQEIKDALGLTVSLQAVGEWLVRLGLRLKKSRSRPRSRTGPTSRPAATPGTRNSEAPTRTRSSSSTSRVPGRT